MPILQLTICEWRGATLTEMIVEHPPWEAVESAIRALDNRERNDVYLTPAPAEPETYLCIGGGAGRYVVAGAVCNEEFPMLLDPSRAAEPPERLTVGGQEGEYPAPQVVGLTTALAAARAFFDAGGYSDSASGVRI
jgi:hypothetical protein